MPQDNIYQVISIMSPLKFGTTLPLFSPIGIILDAYATKVSIYFTFAPLFEV